MPLSEYVVELPAGHREGTGDAEEVDPLVLEVELGITIGGEVRLEDSLELDKLDEVADWVCSMLDEDVDMDMVEESTDLLDELVSIVELVSVAELDPIELDPIEELGVKEVDDDDSLVDDDSLTIEELGERVAVIVMEEEPSREELLPRTSELTIDVLAPDSLDNDDDVGMTGVLAMLLDADEDDGEILADCKLLSVEDRDDALLKPGNWLDDVVF
jgi:hypothetical protein